MFNMHLQYVKTDEIIFGIIPANMRNMVIIPSMGTQKKQQVKSLDRMQIEM